MSNFTLKTAALLITGAWVFPLQVFSSSYPVRNTTGTEKENEVTYFACKNPDIRERMVGRASGVPEVPDMEAPVAYPAENITDSSFTARWSLVQDADGYALDVRRTDRIWQDGEAIVISEDFSKITQGTVSRPVALDLMSFLPGMTKESGWEALGCFTARGMIGLGNYNEFFDFSTLYLPPVDVSNKEGVFNIRMKLAGTPGDVIIADYTLDRSDFIQSPDGPKEYVLKSANDECTFTFSAGTRFSSIKLLSKKGNKNVVFIDEISVGHTVKRGDLFSVSCFYEEFDDPTLSVYDVKGVSVYKEGSLFSYDVMAYDMVYPTERVLNCSDWSNAVVISDMTSVEETRTDNKSPIRVEPGRVHIAGTNNEAVQVFSMTGALVYQEKAPRKISSTELQTGLYIVRLGVKTVKIVVP